MEGNSLDLSAFTGKVVDITFEVAGGPKGDDRNDEALWAHPLLRVINHDPITCRAFKHCTNEGPIKVLIKKIIVRVFSCLAGFLLLLTYSRADTLSSQAAPIIKTGQTDCYDTVGNTIACKGTGQDGEFQKGMTWPHPRFTDHGNGTVTDNLTGFMWTKDAQQIKGTKKWNDALIRCNNFDFAGYTDWRLPNVRELLSLIDYGEHDPALPVKPSLYQCAVYILTGPALPMMPFLNTAGVYTCIMVMCTTIIRLLRVMCGQSAMAGDGDAVRTALQSRTKKQMPRCRLCLTIPPCRREFQIVPGCSAFSFCEWIQ